MRVGAINVPPSYPVRPVNGFMVACLMAPSGEANVIEPPELRPLLGEAYEISIEPPRQLLPSDPDYREHCLVYLARLRRLGEQRLAVTLRLMRERPGSPLRRLLRTGPHPALLLEPSRRRRAAGVPAEVVAEIASAARTIFRQLDGALGELVREAGLTPSRSSSPTTASDRPRSASCT
jgi:hypothetical protein